MLKKPLNVTPKAFRVWDSKHNRWFNGSTDQESRNLQTDSVHYFGEWLMMQGTMYDQNEDGVWRDDPDIKGSLQILDFLEVVQDTGIEDKNGNRIFEYDLVTAEDADGMLDGTICRVEYQDNGYVLTNENGYRRIDEEVFNIEIQCSYFEKPELYS
ncbi:MAG: YopX family protein [Acetobacter sp.]|nr:YopX family protein [Acetobacter sp.]